MSFREGVLSFEHSFAVKIRRIKVMFFICHNLVSSSLHFYSGLLVSLNAEKSSA